MTQSLCPECGQWTGPSPCLNADQLKRFEEICDKYYIPPDKRPSGWEKGGGWEPRPLDANEVGELIDMVTNLRS